MCLWELTCLAISRTCCFHSVKYNWNYGLDCVTVHLDLIRDSSLDPQKKEQYLTIRIMFVQNSTFKQIPVKFQHLQLRLRQSLPRKASTKKDSARLRTMQPWEKYFSLDASTCYLSQSVCAVIEFRCLKLSRTPITEQYLQIVSKKKKGGGEYQLC